MRYIIFTLFITANIQAQTKVKDTLAINILTTVDKVLRIAEDPKRGAMELAGEPIHSELNGSMIYRSSLAFPGNAKTELLQTSTYRIDGYANWQWRVFLLEVPKGEKAALIAETQKKADTILTSFNSRKKTTSPYEDYKLTTAPLINSTWFDTDGLLLIVSFTKKIHNTEQQALDSLVRLYKPLMVNPAIAKEYAPVFGNALRFEDIATDKAKAAYINVVKEIADKNITAAFNMLINGPYFVDMQEAMAQLNSSQQTRIREMAQKAVEDYAANNNRTRTDPVVEKQKEIKENQPPSDPCEREIWELSIKPGYYVSGNNRVAYVRDYSCATDRYTILWMDASKSNRLSSEGLTVEEMKAYRHTSAAPFIVCSNCRGIGYSMEYDWYQVNVASNAYARSNDQRKYTCGVCSGAGYIKVK